VRSARTFSYAATALENLASRAYLTQPYNETAFPGAFFTSTFESSAIDPVSVVRVRDSIYRSTWSRGVDAVSAVLGTGALEGEFVLDPATTSKTDWIVTMPTRNAYVRPGLQPTPPFVPELPDHVCGGVHMFAGSRDQTSRGGDVSFGVPLPGSPMLCWSANVYSFRKSNSSSSGSSDVVASRNTKPFMPTGSDNGWGRLEPTGYLLVPLSTSVFSGSSGTTTQIDPLAISFPVIGLALSTYDNGFLDCGGKVCKGNFGTAVPLRSRRFGAY